MLVVERVNEDEFALVVCNTGAGAETYHPSVQSAADAGGSSTRTYRVAVRLSVSARRLEQPVVWWLLLRTSIFSCDAGKTSMVSMFYEEYLPMVVGKSFAAAAQENAGKHGPLAGLYLSEYMHCAQSTDMYSPRSLHVYLVYVYICIYTRTCTVGD